MNRYIGLFILALAAPSPMWAAPPEVQKNLRDAQLNGAATASILTKEIYDAELWTKGNMGYAPNKEFALSLTYKARFSASLLAWATVKEIARIEGKSSTDFEGLEDRLTSCFADVKSGDRITGISKRPDLVQFFANGKKKCDMVYPNFSKRFFGIWLGPKSRDQRASAKLRGAK